MRVVVLEADPFHTLKYSLGPGRASPTAVLPFHRAIVEGLPQTLDAIIATSDLQGLIQDKNLGEALAAELEALRARGELAPRDRTAAFLCGDLHPGADEADVRSVWRAMSRHCR